MFSACPVRVSVPRISNAAVVAMSEAPITKLRSVCTAITSLAGLAMTCFTQRARASSFTPWMLAGGARRVRARRAA